MPHTETAINQSKIDFPVDEIRQDFPVLHQQMNDNPLVYLDNAATTQKPRKVIDTINNYYEVQNSNIHRGVYELSQKATDEYESTRKVIQQFIGAREEDEIIFTRGTTDSINLVANTYGLWNIGEGDEVLLTGMEHHSNIVPWQMLCERTGATLKVAPVNDKGELVVEEFENLITDQTKLVALVHISNTLGTINPAEELIRIAHEKKVPVLLDGAQSIQHHNVNVSELDCDFFCFSGHKIYGPTGIGVLYGKKHLLDRMPPYQGGGDMIEEVTFAGTTYDQVPQKFEAGTPNIAGVIGLKAAIQYVEEIGVHSISAYEQELLDYATEEVKQIDGMRIIGTAEHKTSSLSFLLGEVHPYDTGVLLDKMGICVRTGHHCTQPLMKQYNIPGTCRASFSFYNTKEEVDKLVEGLKKVKKMFG